MRFLSQLVLAIFLIVCSVAVVAQDSTRRFERLTIEQGLSQNTVTAVAQDHQGFIWIGTRDGLNRFDGYQFKVFRHNAQQGSISDNYIWSLLVDQQGILWVGTANGGLNRYDPKTQGFTQFIHDPNKPDSLNDVGVRSIYQDSQGTLWLGTNAGGLNRFDRQKQSFEHWKADIHDQGSLSNNRIYEMSEGEPGQLWLGTAGGVSFFDIKKQSFVRYVHNPKDPHSLSHDRVRSVFKDQRGRLWFGTDGGGLNLFDPQTRQFESFRHDENDPNSLSNDFIISVRSENADRLWVGTWGGGLNLFNLVTRRFQTIAHNPANSFSLSNNLIYTLFKDSKGMLWVGTSGGGINKFDSRTERFGHIYQQSDQSDSLSENNVRTVLQDSQGTLWIGTRGGGLNRQDPGAKGFIQYRHDPLVPNSLSNGQVYTLFEDSNGYLWIGTAEGLNRFDRKRQQFTLFSHDPTDPNSISDNRVKHIIEARRGILWIGTSGGGINRFDTEAGTFEAFRHNEQDPTSLSHDIVSYLHLDRKGELWVATIGGGLNRFNPASGQFEHFQHQANNPQSLSHNRVLTLHEDQSGSLWVGTARGLNKLDPSSGSIARYFEQDGLANDVILAILEDQRGHLWVSGNAGLTRFNPELGQFKIFDVFDGLQSNEFNLNAAFANADGELIFGGINGINRFYPQHIVDDTRPPQIQLTGFLLSNQPVEIASSQSTESFSLPMSINQMDTLELTHRQTLVAFEFAALDYANPMKNQYAYQLQGWDEDWIYTDASRRFASYTKLAPGEYEFKVKASNKDGYWSEQGKSLHITVLPPWYLTWQAYLIYIVVTVGGIVSAHQYKTRKLWQRANELERKVTERTATIDQLMQQKQRMFANVSHEFKTPLTLILNPLDSLMKDPRSANFSGKLEMMKRNGQRLLRMVEQLLELSKIEASPQGQKRVHYSLATMLERLLLAFQPLSDAKQLKLNCEPFEDVVVSTTADGLEMLLSNLISNAIKYTPAQGCININVEVQSQQVSIAVADSGVGISQVDQQIVFNRFTRANETHDESIPGAGIGLALVKELVELNHGTITLDSEPGKGSTFTVTLPVSDKTTSVLTHTDILKAPNYFDIPSEVAEHASQTINTPEIIKAQDGLPSILLIDDNADMLALLQDILSEHYQCILASNGEQGLQRAQQYLPELVISDVMMPGMNGFELLTALKQSDLTNHIPVILLTAKGDVKSRIKGWTEKADEYLEKPFNTEELLIRIDNLLAIRTLLRRRYQSEMLAKTEKVAVSQTVKSPPKQHSKTNGETGLAQVNQVFFDKVNRVLESHYTDETLDVSFLATELAMSQRQLGRKMKAVLDFTPAELIRVFRLKKAAELLKQGEPAGAVAHKVGFSSHSYFSQCFKAQYDCLPSSYH